MGFVEADASSPNAVWFEISDTAHASFANDVVFTSYPPATSREAVRTINAYALSFGGLPFTKASRQSCDAHSIQSLRHPPSGAIAQFGSTSDASGTEMPERTSTTFFLLKK